MTGPASGRAPTWVLLACVGLLVLIWSSTWLVIKDGLSDIPPFTGAGLRFLLAGLVMAVLARLFASREGGNRPPLWLSACLGSTNFAISYGIIYWAETVLPSGVVAVLYAIFPLLMAVSGHFFLPGERLRPRQLIGFLVAFGGVAFLSSGDLSLTGSGTARAAAITLLSPLVSVIGNTAVKRHGRQVSSLLLNRDAMLFGSGLLLAAAWLFERDRTPAFGGEAILGLLYLSLGGTVVAFGLYFWLLRQVPAAQLSLIAFVIPLLALIFGATLGDEPVTREVLVGTGLILAGVIAARSGRPIRPPLGDRRAPAALPAAPRVEI